MIEGVVNLCTRAQDANSAARPFPMPPVLVYRIIVYLREPMRPDPSPARVSASPNRILVAPDDEPRRLSGLSGGSWR
jgi:hypothetical protein